VHERLPPQRDPVAPVRTPAPSLPDAEPAIPVRRHHSLQRLVNPDVNANPGEPPLQRTIRVDAMDDGAEFEQIEGWVPRHFGFSEAGKTVYLTWLKDGIDHHYANKAALVAAVEHATNDPTTESFRDMFAAAAAKSGLDVGKLEFYLNARDASLQSLAQFSAADIRGQLVQRGAVVAGRIEDWNVRQLIDAIVSRQILTGVCGETANLVHGLLSPGTAGNVAAQNSNRQDVLDAVTAANARSIARRRHQYVRVMDQGHAFIIEVANDTARLIQSFIGKYTLAANLQRDKSYALADFMTKLDAALVLGAGNGATDPARVDLFSSHAYHGSNTFSVTSFEAEDGTKDRSAEAARTGEASWGARLEAPAGDVLQAPPAHDAPVEDATALLTPTFEECVYLFYPSPQVSSEDDDDFNERMCAGNVDAGITVRHEHGDHYLYRIASKGGGRYRLERIGPAKAPAAAT
jgi:hypothetical protein